MPVVPLERHTAVACGVVLSLLVLMGMGDPVPRPYVFPSLELFPPMPVPAYGPVTVEGAELGRMLFYDPVLSADGTLSCASCHQQRYAFSDGPQASSLGLSGTPTPRNTSALFNLAWYPAFFWDGRSPSLEDQVLHPVRDPDELGAGWPVVQDRLAQDERYRSGFRAAFGSEYPDSMLIARALSQFLRTLISADSKYDRVLRGEARFTEAEHAGFVLANEQNKGDCLQCHTTDRDALGTALRSSNNGLPPASGLSDNVDMGRGAVTGAAHEMGQFKIPSLRNVGVTAPYMHDGRFATLEEVVEFYSSGVQASANTDPRMGTAHRGGAHLSATEKAQLIAFLLTLTDSTFISDPRHADPFGGSR